MITDTQTLSNKTLTTPNIGAATGTQLVLTGKIDETTALTVANGGTITAATSLNFTTGTTTWTLPATAIGKQACFRQNLAGAVAISVTPPSGSYVENQARTATCTQSHAIKSGGVATDSVCFVAVNATSWAMLGDVGTWTCQ